MANNGKDNLEMVESIVFKTYMVFYASIVLVIYLIFYRKPLYKKYHVMYVIFLILSIIFLIIMYTFSAAADVTETTIQKMYNITKSLGKLKITQPTNQKSI